MVSNIQNNRCSKTYNCPIFPFLIYVFVLILTHYILYRRYYVKKS